MMSDNSIETLRTLHNLRANMQLFSQNPDFYSDKGEIISDYLLLKDEDERHKFSDSIREFILNKLVEGDFNYFKYKTTTQKEDIKRRSSARNTKEINTEAAKLRKQIAEEIAFLANNPKTKAEFTGFENAEILAINLQDNYFNVQISGQKEPLKINCYFHKGKKISPIGRARVIDKNTPKAGLTDKNIALLETLGEKGYIIQELEQPKDMGKKYTLAEFRKLLGLKSGEALSSRQKDMLEFLNKLTLSDQQSLVSDLHKRRVKLKLHAEVADFAKNKKDLFEVLINPKELRDLLQKNEIVDFCDEMQKRYIYIIQENKEIWNNFSKKKEDNNNQRYSQYEILQNNIISANKEVFSDIFQGDLSDKKILQENISKAFSTIRHLTEPVLSDELCAEIIALGVFRTAVNKNTTSETLKKMNIVLNEFGINIALKSLPITKVPEDKVKGAAEQSMIDRQNFEELKRGKTYIDNEKKFAAVLYEKGIVNACNTSTHHYFALKYNAFVTPELNSNNLLVKTAQANPWNYDGHDTTHLFDTTGEFLIKDDKGNYSLADFNRIRNRFKQGEKMEIQVPILQVKNQNNEYDDLLALGKGGDMGYYISDNHTAPIIKVPGFVNSGRIYDLKLKLEKKISKIK